MKCDSDGIERLDTAIECIVPDEHQAGVIKDTILHFCLFHIIGYGFQ
jgi:hypothetical protein